MDIQCFRRRCEYDADRWHRRDSNNLTFDKQNQHSMLTTDVSELKVCIDRLPRRQTFYWLFHF